MRPSKPAVPATLIAEGPRLMGPSGIFVKSPTRVCTSGTTDADRANGEVSALRATAVAVISRTLPQQSSARGGDRWLRISEGGNTRRGYHAWSGVAYVKVCRSVCVVRSYHAW